MSVSSPFVFDVFILCGLCDGPSLSLSSTSFGFVNIKKYNVGINGNYKTKPRKEILTIQ